MDRHTRAKRGDFSWELVAGLGTQMIGPFIQGEPGGLIELLQLFNAQALGVSDRRQPGPMQYFIRVGVADPAEQTRVTQGSLEGVITFVELGCELVEGHFQGFKAARIFFGESSAVEEQFEPGPPLRTGFGDGQGAGGKVESR